MLASKLPIVFHELFLCISFFHTRTPVHRYIGYICASLDKGHTCTIADVNVPTTDFSRARVTFHGLLRREYCRGAPVADRQQCGVRVASAFFLCKRLPFTKHDRIVCMLEHLALCNHDVATSYSA